MEGYNVLFPIGFDAFGLPTENYAVKTGQHPRVITDENIKRFSNQLKKVGFSFDWSRVIDTTDEDYYKWTQWIFLKMFEKGLVFRDKNSCKLLPVTVRLFFPMRTARAANAISATAMLYRNPRTYGI